MGTENESVFSGIKGRTETSNNPTTALGRRVFLKKWILHDLGTPRTERVETPLDSVSSKFASVKRSERTAGDAKKTTMLGSSSSFNEFHLLNTMNLTGALNDGAKEVYNALKEGKLNPDDMRTITIEWYKHLLEMHALSKDLTINGALL
jgi:hypothetical protein